VPCVCYLQLEPVIEVELYNSLGEIRQLMHDCNTNIAVVGDETSVKMVGIVDKGILDLWNSPLLDTAAERAIDRNIENKLIHQVMSHYVPIVEGKIILKDAKYLLDKDPMSFF